MSPSRTCMLMVPWAAAHELLLLLVASCTTSSAGRRRPSAFTSKLPIPSFTGRCPARTVPSDSGRTVVIPLHIQTPSAVTSQIFAGVARTATAPTRSSSTPDHTTPSSTSPWPRDWD